MFGYPDFHKRLQNAHGKVIYLFKVNKSLQEPMHFAKKF